MADRRRICCSNAAPIPRSRAFALATAKRPAQELYDLSKDPDQLQNVAGRREYQADQKRLAAMLEKWMRDTSDPGSHRTTIGGTPVLRESREVAGFRSTAIRDPGSGALSGDQVLHDLPVHVGQSEAASLIEVRQPLVIDAEQIEQVAWKSCTWTGCSATL